MHTPGEKLFETRGWRLPSGQLQSFLPSSMSLYRAAGDIDFRLERLKYYIREGEEREEGKGRRESQTIECRRLKCTTSVCRRR